MTQLISLSAVHEKEVTVHDVPGASIQSLETLQLEVQGHLVEVTATNITG